MTNRFIYLSFPLSERTPVYGGGAGIKIKQNKSILNGDSCNTEEWNIPNHIGTHIDAPRHFFEEGKTIDEYPPEFWICNNVKVINCSIEEARWILPEDLEGKIDSEIDCILIRTGFQKFRDEELYYKDNPGLSPELAKWLRSYYPVVKFVGVDFVSVSRILDREKGRMTHRELLQPGPPGCPILPIEDMDMSFLSSDVAIDELRIFPIRVLGADGAPVTIVAEIK